MVCMGGLSHPSAPAGDLARRDAGARDRVASAAADARSPATRQAYAAQWRRFERWCAGRDIDAPAATPAEIVVAAYLAERAEQSKLATVRSAAAAIAAACRAAGRPDPTKTPIVADMLRGIARQPGAAPRQARALTYDQARELMLVARERRRGGGRGLEELRDAVRPAGLERVIPLSPYLTRTRELGERRMSRVDVFRMVKRRVKAVELGHAAICHTFRASGITAYLLNGGTLEPAQAIAGHESHRTTQLYHRTADDITVEDVERIKI